MHSTVTNTSRITFTTAGVYNVEGQVRFAANATGFRKVLIRLNGTTTIAEHRVPNSHASVAVIISISAQYKFAANDYVELVAHQNSGVALNSENDATHAPHFSAAKVATG